MGASSTIEWTNATWNPVRGCSVVSPGCHQCYARAIAGRFSGEGQPYHGLAIMTEHGPQWTGEVRLVREHLEDPLKWRKPRRIFVNSMSDLFHESLSDYDIANVFGVMEAARRHTFQILTKRAGRMRQWVTEWAGKIDYADDRPCGYARRYSHVWLGVSVEDQQRANERMPELLDTPAAVRFVSYEPALENVDFTTWLATTKVHWLICGAESGPGARYFNIGWARAARDQCVKYGVSYFFKQDAKNGHKIPTPELDGKRWTQFPEVRA